MIEQWVMPGNSLAYRVGEDRETFHRLADRRRIGRAFAWLLRMPTRWAAALLMWVSVRQLAAADGDPWMAVVVPAPASVPAVVRWLRVWAVCVPHNGPNVGGFGTRRFMAT